MALLDQIRQKNPSLRDRSDDEIKSLIRTSPEFQYFSDDEFDAFVTGSQPGEQNAGDKTPGFTGGLAAGIDQLQAMGGGLVMAAGEAMESEGLLNAGRDIYARNMEEAGENDLGYGFTDIRSAGDAWNWARYTAGNLLPMMAASVAGGGVGGLAVGTGAKMVAGATARQAAIRAGQALGAGGASVGMETGALMGETEDLDVSLAHGTLAGALDALVPIKLLRSAGKSELADQAADEISDRVLADLRREAGRTTGQAARSGSLTGLMAEATTEGLQGLINQHANYWVENNGETLLANLGEVDLKAIVDEAAAGGLMGGIVGAPAGIGERSQARTQVERIDQAREQAAAQGGDALAQTLAAQEAEQETQPTDAPPDPAVSAEIGNRIQLAMGELDDLQSLSRGSSYQGQTRLRNISTILDRAERAYEEGNLDQARRLTERAEGIATNLRGALQQAGTRERPMEGELFDPEAPQQPAGLLGQDSRRLPPGDPSTIYAEGPTADTTQYDPQARNVRRDEAMAAQQQGEARMREQAASQRLQLTDSGTIYGQGPVAGNANTGMDQPFARAGFTDTGAGLDTEASRARQQQQAEDVARLSRTRGRSETTYLPDNTPVRTRFRVVDAAELSPSNSPDGRINPGYPQELQPRDRTNANSQVQVRNIAARLNPERLGSSRDAGTGAPIIGPDGVVESGNGRTMAIAQAYQQGGDRAEAYRRFVREQAEAQGIDPTAVDEMPQPVLVRERVTSIDRADFARRANESQVAGMTAYEQAQADADSLTADDLQAWAPDQTGDPLAASNRSFQGAFVARLGNNEAARYTTRDGQASPELGARMQRAVFAKAYQDADMVEMATEQGDQMRNLTAALQVAAPDLAIAREAGSQEAVAAIGTLGDAVRIVRRARQDGISVRELTRQSDAFSDPVPETTALLAVVFQTNLRSRRALSEGMRYIGQAVRTRAENERNGALFEDTTTNEDVFNAAFQEDPAQRTEQRSPEGSVQPGAERGEREPSQGREAETTAGPQDADAVDGAPLLANHDEQGESGQRPAQEGSFTADNEQSPSQAASAEQEEAIQALRDQGYSLAPERAETSEPAPRAEDIASALEGIEELAGARVIQSARELPPQALLGMAIRGVSPADVRGMYIGGDLYVIADNVESVQEGIRTAVHEAVGHKGMRAVLGADLERVMLSLYRSLPNSKEGREALAEVRRDYPFLDPAKREDRVTIAEEMTAHLLEKGHRPKAWQRAVAKIRELLRRLIPSIAWTYSDVLSLGEQSREYLRRQKAERDGEDVQLFSLAGKARTGFETQFDDFTDADRAAAAKIGSRTPPQRAVAWFKEHAERAGLKIRQGMVDRVAALKEIDEKLYGESALGENITRSSWVLARMSNAANGALHALLHNGRIRLDPDQKVITLQEGDAKGLGEVLGRLGSAAEIERFMGWIAGNRAARLAGEGRENLFDMSDIEAMKGWNRGQMADGRSREAVYREVFEEFQTYRDDVLAVAEQSGIISKEQREMWAEEFYVPFYRLAEDSNGQVSGMMATSGLSRQQAYKRLKGGTQNLSDLLQNSMMNFHHLLDASLKNQAAVQAVENAKQLGMVEKVPESGRDTKKSTFVMEGGKKVYYEIDDPLVFHALTALAHPGMNSTAMKVMRGFKRVFTNLTTTTPQFMVANLIRDSLQATATNNVSKNAFKNVIGGAGAYRDQRIRAQMLASGASFNFGHLYGNNPDELRAQLTRNMRNTNIVAGPSGVPNVLRAGWTWWNEVNNATENLNRAAIYTQNREGGELRAAFEARDLIDFSAHGAWPAVRILIDIVPFLNARIQGLDKIYRSGVKPGASVVAEAFGYGKAGVTDKQAAARFWTVTGALAAATIALYLHNQDDEEYQKLEDWQKDTYWFFRAGDQAFFIPKPFEVGAIATLAERITEQFADDQATGAVFRQRLMHMMTDTFSFSPVPQAVQPALDIYANYDAFTGRPIEGMGMERLSPELRRRARTSKAGEWISKGLNATVGAIGDPDKNPLALSPVQVDHLIGGYLGQVGTWVASSGDVAWRAATGQEDPARRWYEFQPVRRFYRNLGDEDRYIKYGTVFYEGLREAGRAYADVKELREQGRLADAAERAESNREILALRKPLNRAQTRLRRINQQIDVIRRSNLDGEIKRQRIDRLSGVKNQIQRALGERILEARAG